MSDLDLAALTEAVHARLAAIPLVGWQMDEDGEPEHWEDFVSGPLTAVVRAVLEALPREWAVRHDNAPCDERIHRGPWSTDLNWVEPQAGLCGGCYVVWRAVGPPIPAEDQP